MIFELETTKIVYIQRNKSLTRGTKVFFLLIEAFCEAQHKAHFEFTKKGKCKFKSKKEIYHHLIGLYKEERKRLCVEFHSFLSDLPEDLLREIVCIVPLKIYESSAANMQKFERFIEKWHL